jgi:hypothetical protein
MLEASCQARRVRISSSAVRWETTSSLDAAGVTTSQVWTRAYADASSWPRWNGALSSAKLEGPFAVGQRARVRFSSGLRLWFTLQEVEAERLFTDESRLPGGRIGHRHELEPTADGVRLKNTIYIDGPLTPVWSRVLGPRAARDLPEWQRRIVALARG